MARPRRKPKAETYARPYATHYYTDLHSRLPAYTSHGACASEMGALGSTMRWIYQKIYAKAICIDRVHQVVLWHCKIGPNGLPQFGYGRERDETLPQWAEQQSRLRRVK